MGNSMIETVDIFIDTVSVQTLERWTITMITRKETVVANLKPLYKIAPKYTEARDESCQ